MGPEAVVVTKITPLYLILTLDSVETNVDNELGARYVIGVERQAAAARAAEQAAALCVSRGKNDVFHHHRRERFAGQSGAVELFCG